VNWARSRKKPLALMVSEFYRVDTPGWHHLHDTFECFSDREIPTIMWGFLSSNLFTDPKTRGPGKGIYVDGVVDAALRSSKALQWLEENEPNLMWSDKRRAYVRKK
jgi:hypothetical protein